MITFLLTTEIIPLCLRIMEFGSELSKTVATFILQKILLDESGLSHICQTYERFSHVAIILVSAHKLYNIYIYKYIVIYRVRSSPSIMQNFIHHARIFFTLFLIH